MISVDREIFFKASTIIGLLFFVFTLIKTNVRDPRRPMLLLMLYMGFILAQSLCMIEFFPLSAFQDNSFPAEQIANYVRFRATREDGQEVTIPIQRVMPLLSGNRIVKFSRDAFANQKNADDFFEAYQRAYDKRVRWVDGGPGIRQIEFEKWKWDYIHDPYDPERGFVVQRVDAKPRQV